MYEVCKNLRRTSCLGMLRKSRHKGVRLFGENGELDVAAGRSICRGEALGSVKWNSVVARALKNQKRWDIEGMPALQHSQRITFQHRVLTCKIRIVGLYKALVISFECEIVTFQRIQYGPSDGNVRQPGILDARAGKLNRRIPWVTRTKCAQE